MIIQSISFGYPSTDLTKTKDFYMQNFLATLVLEVEGYLILSIDDGKAILEFTAVQDPDNPPSYPDSIGFSFLVEDVDEVYKQLSAAGIPITMPLSDHSLGERGFAIKDPNGLAIYIFSSTADSG